MALASGRAFAQSPAPVPTVLSIPEPRILDRPHTVAELETGVIILPTAPISVANRGGTTPFGRIGRGDATLQMGLHLVFRGGPDWALGVMAAFSPLPISDSDYRNAYGLQRTHSRNYLYIALEGRYVPLRFGRFDIWTGLTVGGVVVADRFVTVGEAVPAILGSRQLTVRSEGFALGIQVGATYSLTESLVVGITGRATRWFLPNAQGDPTTDPSCSSIGDCPTLTGPIESFELGASIGYRIPL